jgi:hypothetical protein
LPAITLLDQLMGRVGGVRITKKCGALSVEATMGDADMSRRRKTKPADLTLDKLTWLFAGLIILAAVAGVIGGVAR